MFLNLIRQKLLMESGLLCIPADNPYADVIKKKVTPIYPKLPIISWIRFWYAWGIWTRTTMRHQNPRIAFELYWSKKLLFPAGKYLAPNTNVKSKNKRIPPIIIRSIIVMLPSVTLLELYDAHSLKSTICFVIWKLSLMTIPHEWKSDY
jgi:hypothetical protein